MRYFQKLSVLMLGLVCLFSCSTTKVAEQSPMQKKAELYYDYGTKHLIDKKYTKALTNLKKALELEPNNSKIHNNLGMSYFFKNEQETAIKHLQKSIELDPNNSDAQNNLASIYFYRKKYKKAYDMYLSILENLEYGQQYRTHYNLALIDIKFKKLQKAHKRLSLSVKENPNYCPAHYQLGSLSYQKGNLPAALKHFTDGTQGTCLNNPAPHLEKAKVLIDLREDQKALFVLRSLIERFPKTKYAVAAKRKLQVLNINKFRKAHNAQKQTKANTEKL